MVQMEEQSIHLLDKNGGPQVSLASAASILEKNDSAIHILTAFF